MAAVDFDPTENFNRNMFGQTEILSKPRFTPAEAEAISREHFGISATASELTGERDQNFLLQCRQGKFVLKIANPKCELALLELENAAIGVVAGLESIESPVLQKSVGGIAIVPITNAQGQDCFTRLVEFVPGIPWAEFRPHSKELLVGLGRALGEVDIELSSLNSQRAARRELLWDLARGPTVVAESLHLFEQEPNKSQLLQLVLNRHSKIASRLEDLPRSVIHNDANDHNNLVDLKPAAD